jgi:hypothetical protein
LIFDKDFHGWDGYVCHNESQGLLPRPSLKSWNCLECASHHHACRVSVYGEGSNDFAQNVGSEFPPDRWPDGFGWFHISIACDHCHHRTDNWVDYETM